MSASPHNASPRTPPKRRPLLESSSRAARPRPAHHSDILLVAFAVRARPCHRPRARGSAHVPQSCGVAVPLRSTPRPEVLSCRLLGCPSAMKQSMLASSPGQAAIAGATREQKMHSNVHEQTDTDAHFRSFLRAPCSLRGHVPVGSPCGVPQGPPEKPARGAVTEGDDYVETARSLRLASAKFSPTKPCAKSG